MCTKDHLHKLNDATAFQDVYTSIYCEIVIIPLSLTHVIKSRKKSHYI